MGNGNDLSISTIMVCLFSVYCLLFLFIETGVMQTEQHIIQKNRRPNCNPVRLILF